MARQRSEELERYWRGLIARQERTGVSIAAFCRDEGVTATSFYSWRRRLEQRDGGDSPNGDFVEVPILPVAAPEPCEVVLPNGRRVIVPPRFDAASLRELIVVLEGESPC